MSILVRNKLPSLKINMSHQILTPCRFNSRFKSKYQYTLQPHLFSKLISSESLTKTHFSIPKEFRNIIRAILKRTLEIVHCAFYSTVLLRSHTTIKMPIFYIFCAITNSNNSSLNICNSTLKPFVTRLIRI